jgi:DNA invertase Pin-like site-specific DNA recombinase
MFSKDCHAAQYVRMSTDMQRYSIENQSEAIAVYAVSHGLTIVRSYEDAGRSGVRLDGRTALRQLLGDVRSGCADFSVILVYDVSRWGRFQDSDESAYHEFICKEAGVRVEYCAEQFANDGSLTSTVLKNIKRAMAGEFSRELSKKVFVGKCRIASMGFRTGATPGYGLRRCLLDEHGNRRMSLDFGQQKSLHTDRVILVPGPVEEIRVLNRVYDWFIDRQLSLNEIARKLNTHGIPNDRGKVWTGVSVRELLSNEKYIGNNIFNRTTVRLGTKKRINPPSEWVRAVGVFEPIVPLKRFQQAQRQLRDNCTAYKTNELLDTLTAIWCHAGALGKKEIEHAKEAPTLQTYRRHFGSLADAFRVVGYRRKTKRGSNQDKRKAIFAAIAVEVAKRGGTTRMLERQSHMRVNEEVTVTVCIGRTRPARPRSRWRFDYKSRRKADILIIVRIDDSSDTIQDYVALPLLFLLHGNLLMISGRSYTRFKDFITKSLAPFYQLCGRIPLET